MNNKKGISVCNEVWLFLQGGVSIMAHSLGSVLSYDVLCNQPHLYAGLHLPQLPAHSPEAVRQSKEARLASAGSQVPLFPASFGIHNTPVIGLRQAALLL